MAVDKVVAPLLRVSLFAGLKPLQITEIARHAERMKFRRGSIIVEGDTAGDGAYLIVSGEAEHRFGHGSLAEPIEPGSLVGELAMLVEYFYRSTVVAVGTVHCLKITRAALHEQMREDLALAEHFASVIGGRLTRMAAELRDINELLVQREQSPAPSTIGSEDSPAPKLLDATATGAHG